MTLIDIDPINKELTTIRRLLTAKYSERNAEKGSYLSWKEVFDLVNKQPAVDAVKVVRCIRCRFYKQQGTRMPPRCEIHNCYPDVGYYCASGKGKDDAVD